MKDRKLRNKRKEWKRIRRVKEAVKPDVELPCTRVQFGDERCQCR